MKNISEAQWDIWEAGDYTGANAIFGEVRITKIVLESVGVYRTLLFADSTPDEVVPNLQTINIDRSLGADAATMTFTFLNVIQPTVADNLDLTHGAAEGPTRRQLGDYGFPGAFTYRRGVTRSSAPRWGHPDDSIWSDMFVPNRVCKTFQGYGTGTLTGIWLIDKVDYKADGQVTVTCRDAAKLLIEQRLYPPIIPIEDYPLRFCVDHEITEFLPVTTQTTSGAAEAITGIQGVNVAFQAPCDATNAIWDSSGGPYYGCNASVQGHTPAMAFDGNNATYWLSIGNALPSADYAFEWLQAGARGEPVNKVTFKPKFGGYKVYVSVQEKINGVFRWQGDDIIPYNPNDPASAPNGADIPYVQTMNIAVGEAFRSFDLDRTYNAYGIRLTFTNLAQTSFPFPFRAGVYEFRARHVTVGTTGSAGTTTEDTQIEETTTSVEGNIIDYVDIVKILAAWSGFFWPNTANPDPLLTKWGNQTGRVWGDFQYSGAWPVEPPCIPESFWDNKSVMDGINQIKEILGYIAYVDSSGGLVFRVPNIWSRGNYITGVGHVQEVRDISEEKVLMDYGVTIDDQNLRSQVTIVSAEDPTFYETVIPGFAADEVALETSEAVGRFSDLALLAGQQRIMLVPDYPFLKQEEVRKFAFLISLWIHWSYRTSSIRIPGIAAFEPDDQVRIFERTTSEDYLHYIQGVNSSMNLATGEWTMDLTTHWLGTDPRENWVVNTAEIDPALFVFLRDIEVLDPFILGDEELWPPRWWEVEAPAIPDDPDRTTAELDALFPDPPPFLHPGDLDLGGDVTGDGGTDGDPGGGSIFSASNVFYDTYWGPRCGSTVRFLLIGINDHGSQTEDVWINIDARSAALWVKVRNKLKARGVIVRQDDTGAFNCKQIRDTGVWSVHSWGLAVDINWLLNPRLTRITSASYANASNFISAMNDCVNDIRANGKQAFRWGAGFSTGFDYMHLEVIVAASDVRAGVTG